MDPQILVWTFTLFFLGVPISLGNGYPYYTACKTSEFKCGDIQNASYPFWGGDRPAYCGHPAFKLRCSHENYAVIEMMSVTYRVLSVNQIKRSLVIARLDLWDGACTENYTDTRLDEKLFSPSSNNTGKVALFYDCSFYNYSTNPIPGVSLDSRFRCPIGNGEPRDAYFVYDEYITTFRAFVDGTICQKNIEVPVQEPGRGELRRHPERTVLQKALKGGFEVVYTDAVIHACVDCGHSDGSCGRNLTTQQPVCFCRDRAYQETCPDSSSGSSGNKTLKRKLIIGFCTAAGTFILTCLGFLMYRHRKKRLHATSALISQEISSDPSSKLDIEKGSKYFGIRIFTYSELEEATNNFDSSKELGDGGFGTVYYGKLRDGRAVAVKRLYENNYKRVEQFMNEIEILAGIRHQNLVTLYGCTSRHSRELLLVYEFIPNGTVADHLHGDRAQPGSLALSTRMSIAIETAGALSYLHASEIVHRDVKTNNILLDNNFRVKVADFGLSRLFPTDVTHVSTAPQGTPGYVDPEYHQCYQLTSKSDVYSFGVVLIELISSMPAVDISRHRYEINLASMAINKIQNGALHELVDPCLGFETDKEAKRMITSVAELAFQCVQHEREARPSMDDVLESLQAIQRNEYKVEKKTQEVNIQRDDVVLLKNIQQPPSPDSVTDKWVSRSTTPNASS